MPAAAVPSATDVLVVGAGPAGSAAAAWAARAGHDVVLADAAVFPRDKTCGDGLTPRAIAELDLLGLGDWVRGLARNRGLRAAGFGHEWQLPWPGGRFPDHGSAVPRTELDARIREVAIESGRHAARRRTGGRRRAGRRAGHRRRVRERRRRAVHRGLPPAGGGRRRAVAAGPGAGPGVAPRHGLRGGGAGLRDLRAQRRRVDLLPPGAARHGGRAAVGLRLGLPAGGRRGRGEHRRGHARDRPPSRGRAAQVPAGDLHRRPPRRVARSTARCGRRRRRCCRWAAPSPGSRGATGR